MVAAPDMVEATIHYLAPDSRINRFFWAPEGRFSTVVSVSEQMPIRNARTVGHDFTLDEHGFALIHSPTTVNDFHHRETVKTIYGAQVADIAQSLTGADVVLPMGWELRSSAGAENMLPPAAKAHIDYDTATAHQIAERRYRKALPDGPGYRRFILFSLWRTFSPGPQDWPLALCDYESARDDLEVRCVKIDVERLPVGDEVFAPIEGEERMGASGMFAFNPAHCWWYYPDMTRDECVFIKFHDSDHSRAWRALHTAFHDESTPDTRPRESIEFRGCAYFNGVAG